VPPSIAVHPTSRTALFGQPTTFSVRAAGTAPLFYQWMKNGTAIGGERSATLTVINTQPSDLGTYAVVVSNLAGLVISNNATLTGPEVLPLAPTSPARVSPGHASHSSHSSHSSMSY